MKRAFDFCFAVAGLTVLALPLGAIALAVSIEDRRTPFFRGPRVGRGGREFRMLKFRTMTPDAWKSGVNSTAAGDRRITRTGRWLRAAKLDELPQLWNVLRGEMSLVGPRPQVPAEVRLYTPEERRMLDVRPGITDLASVVFSDESRILEGAADPDLLYNQIVRPWKSRLALAQIERESVALDVRVLAVTLLAGISRRRALQNIAALLESWNADPALRRAALRREPLSPAPPPGADSIVAEYPRSEAARA
jgi:lipopolysaccharide/colanic/teichoic acid biosynthesis glycosyltransferase